MPFAHPSLFARLLANSVESAEHFFRGCPCWDWIGHRTSRGYGRMARRIEGRKNPVGHWAHRVMAEVILGRPLDPDTETVEHACAWPWCIQPVHLDLAERAANTADMWARRRGQPRKVFKPLVDLELFYFDPFERALPQLRSQTVLEIPF